jgi:hypothetical protein
MNYRKWFGLCCVAAMIALGCDRSPDLPKLPAKTAKMPTVPTTQELMSWPYKTVALTPLPFSAKVPESWENKTPQGTTLNFLQGPLPDGQDVQISLEVGSSMTPDQLKNVLQGGKREADKDKQTIRKFDIHPVGEVQAMEQQRVLTSRDQPEQVIDWRVTFFVQRDLDVETYVVDILGLNEDRFEKSKDLLQKILDSIAYEHT